MKKSQIIRNIIEGDRQMLITEINSVVEKEEGEKEIYLDESVFLQAIDNQISESIRIVLEKRVKVDDNIGGGYFLPFEDISTEKLLQVLEQLEHQEQKN